MKSGKMVLYRIRTTDNSYVTYSKYRIDDPDGIEFEEITDSIEVTAYEILQAAESYLENWNYHRDIEYFYTLYEICNRLCPEYTTEVLWHMLESRME